MAADSYSPPTNQDYPQNVYWGDTHIHTNLSGDAWNGGTRLGLDEAYKFARGEEVISNTGLKAQLSRPLDFVVIADHANNIGTNLARFKANQDPNWIKTKEGRLWDQAFKELKRKPGVNMERVNSGKFWPGTGPGLVSFQHPGFRRSVWEKITSTAERYNEPGRFTAFIGYEWTPEARVVGGAIHRNVIFRDGADKANKVLPFSSFDSNEPEDLWSYLARYEKEVKGSVLAIPHNSNLTNGVMFALVDSKRQPLTKDYAMTRSRWEPLVEATQIKGDSETHPFLSPDDEFADYETWNGWAGRVNGGVMWTGQKTRKREDWKIKHEYVRSALKLGLKQKAETGANPFKFGMIGSSDAHTGLAGVDENNFWGKTAYAEPSARRIFLKASVINWEMNAAGYAGVWARENTRESLFDAMRRKETYATTGPRMTLRFFAGWDFDSVDAFSSNLAEIGYSKGVPMGGDLAHGPKGKSPDFLIRAVKDPAGANLDRIQIVKGWLDTDGELHEKVYNISVSDGRKISKSGKVKAVGSTVDLASASYTNTIGDPELAVVWKDPDFNEKELSFYYVRVLEIPTPRWTAYDAKFFGLSKIPDKVDMVTQERAYSSPIWYTPVGR